MSRSKPPIKPPDLAMRSNTRQTAPQRPSARGYAVGFADLSPPCCAASQGAHMHGKWAHPPLGPTPLQVSPPTTQPGRCVAQDSEANEPRCATNAIPGRPTPHDLSANPQNNLKDTAIVGKSLSRVQGFAWRRSGCLLGSSSPCVFTDTLISNSCFSWLYFSLKLLNLLCNTLVIYVLSLPEDPPLPNACSRCRRYRTAASLLSNTGAERSVLWTDVPQFCVIFSCTKE